MNILIVESKAKCKTLLKHLGKDQVDDDVVAKLDARLDTAARKQLMKDIRSAPAWIADIFRKLAQTTEVSA